MATQQEFYNQLAQIFALSGGLSLAGKPGQQLAGSDVSRAFSPDLGVLTGTYTGRDIPVESDEDIYARVAPDFMQIKQAPGQDIYLDSMVADLDAGVPLLKIRQNLRALLKENGIKTADDENQSKADAQSIDDYEKMLTTLHGQRVKIGEELINKKNKKPEETIFSKAGLPEPETPYDPEPGMGNVYAALLNRAKPSEMTANQKRERDYQAAAGGFEQSKFALEQDFQRKAIKEMGSPKDPSSLRYVYERAISDPKWAEKDRARFEQAKQYLEIASKRKMKDSPEYKAILMDEKDVRANRDRFATGKTYVPVRTALVNKQREDEAAASAANIRKMRMANMQRRGTGSPLGDEMQKRLVLQKILENPALLNVFKNSGA